MTTPAPPLTATEINLIREKAERQFFVALTPSEANRLLSELAQLRREKAEREGMERRRDAFLSASAFHQVRHDFDSDLVEHTVALVDWEGAELGTGPTYEAALAAVLARLEAKERGEAGDRCEAGNECGRLGCPECQQ